MKLSTLAWVVAISLVSTPAARAEEPQKLLHVSFGFTKAFYADYNTWFAAKWLRETGKKIVIEQSHGPSGTQTEAVIAGKLAPDVVTLASPTDLDAIASETGVIAKSWRREFPNASSPYYSAVVFLVRSGNPKNIRDWKDLALPDRTLVTSNPKACGGGRWNYVAAFGIGAEHAAKPDKSDYLGAFLSNAPVLYANQGEAGKAFLDADKGDVLLTYESFAIGTSEQANSDVELVLPARTVEIELPVAVSHQNTKLHGNTDLATAYLRGLYEPEAQQLLVKHHFRPRLKAVADRNAAAFPLINLVKAKDVFGKQDERAQLSDGGAFDQLTSRNATTR